MLRLNLDQEERKLLLANVDRFNERFQNELVKIVRDQIRNLTLPAELIQINEQLTSLKNEFQKSLVDGPVELQETVFPLLKLVLLKKRQETAVGIEERRAHVVD